MTACADIDKVNRRTFLRQAAVVAGSVAASRLVSISSFAGVLDAQSPVATTRSGKVRGYIDNGINVFKGIRYGADTSPRRFMPPLPPETWSEVRDAIAYGPSSPQTSRANDKPNEDCLFLNVWTPGTARWSQAAGDVLHPWRSL